MTTTETMNTYTHLNNVINEMKENGVTPKVKVLKSAVTRKRKSVMNKTASSGKSGLGSHDTSKGSYVSKGDIAIGAGRMGTLNPVNSLGRAYYGDKASVAHNYNLHVAQERKNAALDRIGSV